MSLPNEPIDTQQNDGGSDPVKKVTGQNLKKWYDDFTKAPFIVLSFFAILAFYIQGNSLKSQYNERIVKAETEAAAIKREKFVSDSINEVQKDNIRYSWQKRYDNLDSNYKAVLILFGAKKALEGR